VAVALATIACACDVTDPDEAAIGQVAQADPAVSSVMIHSDWLDGTTIYVTLVEGAGRAEAQRPVCTIYAAGADPSLVSAEVDILDANQNEVNWSDWGCGAPETR
jgi:hypothetical protein